MSRRSALHVASFLTTVFVAVLFALLVAPRAAHAAVPMYRLYNRWNGDHMFTTSVKEYADLSEYGWREEQVKWYAPSSGTDVYRLYNRWSGEHLFTTDRAEYDQRSRDGWTKEGVGLHSGGGVAVYRLYNPHLTAGTHLFTTSKAEYDNLVREGWQGEGVKLYAEQDGPWVGTVTWYFARPRLPHGRAYSRERETTPPYTDHVSFSKEGTGASCVISGALRRSSFRDGLAYLAYSGRGGAYTNDSERTYRFRLTNDTICGSYADNGFYALSQSDFMKQAALPSYATDGRGLNFWGYVIFSVDSNNNILTIYAYP